MPVTPNPSLFQSVQLAKETTPGTAVAANKLLQGLGMSPTPSIPGETFRAPGNVFPGAVILGKARSEGPIEGIWDYNSLAFVFASNLVDVSPSTPAGATNTRLWDFTPPNTSAAALATYTVERGSSLAASRMVNALYNSVTLRATEDEATVSGSMIGKKLTPGITLTGSPTTIEAQVINPTQIAGYMGTTLVNEVQTVTLGGPSAGNFTLTVQLPHWPTSQTTANIAFNAAASAVQDALELLVGEGNVTATGAAGGPYTVTFINRWAALNIPVMTLNSAGLTGGAPSMATTTEGSLTKLLAWHEIEISVNDRVTQGYTLDPAEESFTYLAPRSPDANASMVLMHDSTSEALINAMATADTQIFRMIAEGATIETGFKYGLQYTMASKFREVAVEDRNDVQAATFQLVPTFSTATSYAINVKLWNTVTGL